MKEYEFIFSQNLSRNISHLILLQCVHKQSNRHKINPYDSHLKDQQSTTPNPRPHHSQLPLLNHFSDKSIPIRAHSNSSRMESLDLARGKIPRDVLTVKIATCDISRSSIVAGCLQSTRFFCYGDGDLAHCPIIWIRVGSQGGVAGGVVR